MRKLVENGKNLGTPEKGNLESRKIDQRKETLEMEQRIVKGGAQTEMNKREKGESQRKQIWRKKM